MIANAQTGANVLTGIEKAAILLVVLGDQASSNIVKHLSEDEVEIDVAGSELFIAKGICVDVIYINNDE